MKRRVVPRLTLALCLLTLSSATVLWQAPQTVAEAAGSRGLGKGQQPPAFSAQDLDGRPHSLEQHAGKIIVLHFWATWCPYCRSEIPKLTRIHRELASKDVIVLAVSVDEDLGQLRSFVASSQLPYAVIPDAEGNFALTDAYAVSGIPVTYIIGRDGKMAARLSGAGDMHAIVQRLAGASSGAS